jgi:membrane-associated phospholipid phosphatase
MALGLVGFDALGLWWRGWSIDSTVLLGVAVAVGGFSLIGWIASRDSRLRRVAAVAFALGLLCLLINAAWVATFIAASSGASLYDEAFAAADRTLGFSWPAWKAWSVAHPTFDRVTGVAYESHIVESVIVVAVTAWRRDATPLLRAFTISFLVTLAVSAIVPAIGTETDAAWGVTFAALRAGSFRHITGAQALISMPSFHAVLATLFGLAWWRIPWARWPGVAVNVTMLVATVRWGQHYLVDVLAGVALAFVAAWSAGMLSAPADVRGIAGGAPNG